MLTMHLANWTSKAFAFDLGISKRLVSQPSKCPFIYPEKFLMQKNYNCVKKPQFFGGTKCFKLGKL